MKETFARAVESYLQGKQEEMIKFLERLVQFETPSTESWVHEESHSFLVSNFKKLSFHTNLIKGDKTGGHFYARPSLRKKGEPFQLLVGHSDTVWPVETLSRMPFQVKDGKISGPGVYDMKAGLTQIFFALKCLQDLKVKLEVQPLVFINTDEEIGSFESTKWIQRLAKISSRAFVLEPPLGLEGKLKTSRKGIGKFTLEILGKAAHAGLDPNAGASAILELSHQIQKLFALNNPAENISVNVGLIEGGSRANVIAPSSSAIVDVRVPNRKAADRITEAIYALKPSSDKYKLNVSGGIGRPPMEHTAANRKLWYLAKQKALELDMPLEEASAGGGSDGNTTSQYTATLDGLGTTGDGAHALHEFAFQEQLLQRTALLSLLIAAPKLEL